MPFIKRERKRTCLHFGAVLVWIRRIIAGTEDVDLHTLAEGATPQPRESHEQLGLAFLLLFRRGLRECQHGEKDGDGGSKGENGGT
jgi:hypothetical protein